MDVHIIPLTIKERNRQLSVAITRFLLSWDA